MNDVEKLINHGLLKACGIYLVGVLLWHVVTHQGWYVHIPVWRRKALNLSRPLLSVCCLKSIHKDIHWTRHSGNKTMKITRVPAFSNLPSPVRWGVKYASKSGAWMEEGLLTQRAWGIRREELWRHTALNTQPCPATYKQQSFWMLVSSPVKWEQ